MENINMENNTTVKGFSAAYAACGLKKNNAHDIALIYSEVPAVSAAVFTTSKVKAAPVVLSMENMVHGTARAIIVNAGNANACTGEQGLKNARETTRMVAEALGITPGEVLAASTGVIGAQLDMEKVEKAIPELVKNLAPSNISGVVRAMMTTDSFPKVSSFSEKVKGVDYHVIGIAKGAGMIMPNMATMLCFIITDINISRGLLRRALANGTGNSFNKITVDGDTSTNDTVFIMANGLAGNEEPDEASFTEFQKGLTGIMYDLAKMIVKDGEGATKVIHISVKGAATPDDANKAARTIANSSLVKTAFFGEDPNWGRIMAALGRSGIVMKENRVDILIDNIKIVGQGLGRGFEAEKEAALMMKNPEISLTVELNIGQFSDWITTCDLT
ncbi:MAG: bifunctional glutamate N-acetyltransferase/amino-acid acetyltransferase ArgJ, partial [Deltaproteobacteria bacterium]|nr:bifunctional glutamate N-acetyltransferase/amino-acid acetyltransferase ArgJ [Deltaproteobacteria bacterium]